MRARLLAALLAVVLAIVGTLAIVGYVRGVEQRVAADHETVRLLVVLEPIEQGTAVADFGDRVGVGETVARLVPDGAVTDLSEVRDLVASTDLVAGEPLLRGRLVDPDELDVDVVEIPEDLHQVTISLDAQRAVGGVLHPGATVGLFVSTSLSDVTVGEPAAPAPDDGDDGEAVTAIPPAGTVIDGAVTHLVLHKVPVVRVQYDRAVGEDASTQFERSAPSGRVLVTLAVDAADAETVVFAAEHASIWLSIEPSTASESGTTPRDRESIFR